MLSGARLPQIILRRHGFPELKIWHSIIEATKKSLRTGKGFSSSLPTFTKSTQVSLRAKPFQAGSLVKPQVSGWNANETSISGWVCSLASQTTTFSGPQKTFPFLPLQDIDTWSLRISLQDHNFSHTAATKHFWFMPLKARSWPLVAM